MGKFSGYLICSDFDGTLFIDGKLNGRDTEAIKYFQSEGGLFTYASGRQYTMFLTAPANANAPNAPIIAFNGAHIVAPDGQTVYHRGGITKDEARRLFSLLDGMRCLDRVEINSYGEFGTHDFDENDTPTSREEFLDKFTPKYAKMLVRVFPENADASYEEIKRRLGGEFNVTRSWTVGVEINAPSDSKGIAAKKLKEMLGCHTLVCVGDYDNDIDMIKAADIGYAVGNATDALKAVADRVTVPVRECALATVIGELENEKRGSPRE